MLFLAGIKAFFMKAIYAIIFLVLTFACAKDSGPTSVEGRVLELGSNKPIPNADVFLLREKREMLGAGVWGISNLKTVKSDAEGKFRFNFEADEDYVYGMNAEAPDYQSNSTTYRGVERGKRNKTDIFLNGFGYLKYHIKNVKNQYHIGFSYSCFNSDYFSANTDTSIICQDNGNVNREVIYRLTSFTDTITVKKEIYIPVHDTVSITIEY
ncbi:MAG: hypothetical protein ACXWW0_03400 [Bacteroidia bacterium]